MQNGQKDYSFIECLTVVAIVLFLAAIAIQNVMQSVRASEERTLNAAVVEYSSVRSMYAEQRHTGYSIVAIVNVTAAENSLNKPIN